MALDGFFSLPGHLKEQNLFFFFFLPICFFSLFSKLIRRGVSFSSRWCWKWKFLFSLTCTTSTLGISLGAISLLAWKMPYIPLGTGCPSCIWGTFVPGHNLPWWMWQVIELLTFVLPVLLSRNQKPSTEPQCLRCCGCLC